MARSNTAYSPPQSVDVAVNGKTYRGSYTVAEKTITVSYLGRSQTAQLGAAASAPGALARTMLAAMVQAAMRGK